MRVSATVATLVLGLAWLVSPTAAAPNPGVVWAWGANNIYTTNGGPFRPEVVSGLDGVIAVSGGDQYALALRADGTVWGWGYNASGQLGDGSRATRLAPVQASGLSDVTAIAAGSNRAVALKNDGTVWAWGADGATGEGDWAHPAGFRTSPVRVPGLDHVTAIAAGGDRSLALKADGTVWSWGDVDAQLLRSAIPISNAPIQIPGLNDVTAIAAGGQFGVVLKRDGTVWGWGSNLHGQLGDGTRTNVELHATGSGPHRPVQAKGVTGVTAIAAGGSHTLALKNDGIVWSWGLDGHGELSGQTLLPAERTTPAPVSGLSGVAAIAAGQLHSMAVNGDGGVWVWGSNELGELGDGTPGRHAFELVPIPVPGLPAGPTLIAAGSSGNQSFALLPAGASPQPATLPGASPVDQPTPPPSAASVEPTAPQTAPSPTATPAVPDALTDSVRADILAAVDRANAAWADALRTSDTSKLSDNLAGQLLSDDLAEVDRLRGQGLTQNNTNADFVVTDVTLDAPGHAVVQTQETWQSEISNAATGQVVQTTPSTTYVETYTVAYVNGGWIVTTDDLTPE